MNTHLGFFELIESTGEHSVQVISVETPEQIVLHILPDSPPLSLWWI